MGCISKSGRNSYKLLPYFKPASSTLLECKDLCKPKIYKFGTKNALFGYFLNWNLKKLLSCLKSASNSSKHKYSCKTKETSNMGPKILYLGILGAVTSTLKFVKNVFWVITVNFGIGSAFSKVPSPGPSPLCKVCSLYCLLERLEIKQMFSSKKVSKNF